MDRQMRMLARSLAPVVALILVGCPTDPASDDDDDTYDDPERVDEDEDGYTPDEGDCDDHDADVNPGADEVCDGADNDCDGDTEHQGDCDDTDPDRHPGAAKPQDLTDHDCDGEVYDPGVTQMLLTGTLQATGGAVSGTLEVTYADDGGGAICTHEMTFAGTTTAGDYTGQCHACAEQWDVTLTDAGHDCAFEPGQIIALQKFSDWLSSLWLADQVPYGYCPGDDCDAMDFDALLDQWLAAGDPTLWIWGPDLVHADLPEFIGYLEPQLGASPTLPADGDYAFTAVWGWW